MMALAAVKCLTGVKVRSDPSRSLLNSEGGGWESVSRPNTERLAPGAAAVFVLEPAQGLAYKTARKGVGFYNVQVTGVAAHSGVDFERGHSAILELAKLVETISKFTRSSAQIDGRWRVLLVVEHAQMLSLRTPIPRLTSGSPRPATQPL